MQSSNVDVDEDRNRGVHHDAKQMEDQLLIWQNRERESEIYLAEREANKKQTEKVQGLEISRISEAER